MPESYRQYRDAIALNNIGVDLVHKRCRYTGDQPSFGGGLSQRIERIRLPISLSLLDNADFQCGLSTLKDATVALKNCFRKLADEVNGEMVSLPMNVSTMIDSANRRLAQSVSQAVVAMENSEYHIVVLSDNFEQLLSDGPMPIHRETSGQASELRAKMVYAIRIDDVLSEEVYATDENHELFAAIVLHNLALAHLCHPAEPSHGHNRSVTQRKSQAVSLFRASATIVATLCESLHERPDQRATLQQMVLLNIAVLTTLYKAFQIETQASESIHLEQILRHIDDLRNFGEYLHGSFHWMVHDSRVARAA